MRSYDNCFSGSDAADWLFQYLKDNPGFGDTVTRTKATQLLQKFLENGVFEDVRGKDSKIFEDNGHLYKFTTSDKSDSHRKDIVPQKSLTNLLRSVSTKKTSRPLFSPVSSPLKNPGLETNMDKENDCSGHARVLRSQSLKVDSLSPRVSTILNETYTNGMTPLAFDLETFQINSEKLKSLPDMKKANTPAPPPPYVQEDGAEETSVLFEENEGTLDATLKYSEFSPFGVDNAAFVVKDISPVEGGFVRSRSLKEKRNFKYRHKFMMNCDDEPEDDTMQSLVARQKYRRSRSRTKSLTSGVRLNKKRPSTELPENAAESPTKKRKLGTRKKETCSDRSTANEKNTEHLSIPYSTEGCNRKKRFGPRKEKYVLTVSDATTKQASTPANVANNTYTRTRSLTMSSIPDRKKENNELSADDVNDTWKTTTLER